jgi:hypothetical protein
MDELFDLADVFDLVANSFDGDSLTDNGIEALSQLLGGADYTSFTPDLIDAVANVAPGDLDFWADAGDWFQTLQGMDVDSLPANLDADWFDASTLLSPDFFDISDMGAVGDALSYIDSAAVVDQLNAAVSSIPPAFTDGITAIDWNPAQLASTPEVMGLWVPQATDGTNFAASIELFDHALEAIPTVFHEVGHHIAENVPQFYEEFLSVSSESMPFWEAMSGHLAAYDMSDWGAEGFAEAVSYYNTQPEILQELAPEVFAVIDAGWKAAATAA